jgi:hypothetical protein
MTGIVLGIYVGTQTNIKTFNYLHLTSYEVSLELQLQIPKGYCVDVRISCHVISMATALMTFKISVLSHLANVFPVQKVRTH